MFQNSPRQQPNTMQDQSTPDTRLGPRDALNALEGAVAQIANPNPENPLQPLTGMLTGLAFASAGLPGGSPMGMAKEIMKHALKAS